MWIIKPATLRDYWLSHPDAEPALKAWLALAEQAEWHSIRDVRETLPHADAVTVASGRIATVFNIAGNRYRLITAIHYNTGKVFVMDILSHAEYDKDAWKKRL